MNPLLYLWMSKMPISIYGLHSDFFYHIIFLRYFSRIYNHSSISKPLWTYYCMYDCSNCQLVYLNSIHSFYFLDYTKYRESITFAQKIDFQILMNLHVLRATESKKAIFGMSSVCLSVCVCVCVCVCLSVDTITQKIIELAQPNSVCDLIW